MEILCFVENQPAPEPAGTDYDVPLSRGPRAMPLRHVVTATDEPQLLKDRLIAMAEDPQRQARIRADIEAIYKILRRCKNAGKSRENAIREGSATNSLGMKVRHLHDNLDLHVHRNCLGALYRSSEVIEMAKAGDLASDQVHQEHIIPASVVAGLLYDNFQDAPIEVLANFLLTETTVTAVSRKERDQVLNKLRSYGNDPRMSAWVSEHPEYGYGKPIRNPASRLFLRYHGTGIKVFCWATGVEEEVNFETYTLGDHQERIRKYKLFRYDTYFSPKATPLSAKNVVSKQEA